MQVFLIPIGANEYEPYFEPVEGAEEATDPQGGWLSRQRRKLGDMLREAEAERHRRHDPAADTAAGLVVRWRRKMMRWIVERAAEQRLLWHLRTATGATLVIPHDLAADRAMEILHAGFTRDGDRHFRWFLVNLAGLLVSAATILVPGPNLLGYYFTFTTVGHLLAWRGARHGRHRVQWQVESSAVLTEVRATLSMASPAKEDRLHEAATQLGLRHLASFVDRLAIPPA